MSNFQNNSNFLCIFFYYYIIIAETRQLKKKPKTESHINFTDDQVARSAVFTTLYIHRYILPDFSTTKCKTATQYVRGKRGRDARELMRALISFLPFILEPKRFFAFSTPLTCGSICSFSYVQWTDRFACVYVRS